MELIADIPSGEGTIAGLGGRTPTVVSNGTAFTPVVDERLSGLGTRGEVGVDELEVSVADCLFVLQERNREGIISLAC
jgi:hypothetical protein